VTLELSEVMVALTEVRQRPESPASGREPGPLGRPELEGAKRAVRRLDWIDGAPGTG
jgi:hypothetical protein